MSSRGPGRVPAAFWPGDGRVYGQWKGARGTDAGRRKACPLVQAAVGLSGRRGAAGSALSAISQPVQGTESLRPRPPVTRPRFHVPRSEA